jgi:AAA15 family ATPase/GTPase
MIENIYIKNYKAFRKENIPCASHTILAGTSASGKTTVLEALDCFFNGIIRREYILDKDLELTIEIVYNEKRYRKVFTPPNYDLAYSKCIGDMSEIVNLKYLYIPKHISLSSTTSNLLSLHLQSGLTEKEITSIKAVYNKLDIPKSEHFNLFDTTKRVFVDMDDVANPANEYLYKLLKSNQKSHVILGIDVPEENLKSTEIIALKNQYHQMIIATKSKDILRDKSFHITHLYTGDIEKDFYITKQRIINNNHKTYILVEGKYDVAWFEKALELLEIEEDYAVIPCGGFGNIRFVKEQLIKEGYQTIVITDGDTNSVGSLKRDIIELYADYRYINKRFHTNFKHTPRNKHTLFKAIHEKDDVVKNVLSRWAKRSLTVTSPFVKELKHILNLKEE